MSATTKQPPQLTVFFPKHVTWREAEEWVRERRLPVTMWKSPSVFAGETFPRYCNEIESKDGCMIYERQKLTLRRKR